MVRAFIMSPDVPSRARYPALFHTATPDLHIKRRGSVVKAPKRGREEQQRNGFQVVHIAPVKRRLMERLEGMPRAWPRGDG